MSEVKAKKIKIKNVTYSFSDFVDTDSYYNSDEGCWRYIPSDKDILTITQHGSYTARCAALGLEVTKQRGSLIGALCRKMIADKVDPRALVRVTRDGTLCFHPRPVGSWAGLTVEENDGCAIRHRPYREHQLCHAPAVGRKHATAV